MANQFEQNSRKTLFMVFFIILLLLLIGFEKLLGISLGHVEEQVRHIRLREHSPLLDKMMTPIASELETVDKLKNKSFPFKTDENGFINPSFLYDKPDLTLVFIGGSTTECMYIDPEKRFPYLTGKLLSSDNYKVNAINSGVSGNDTLNSLNSYLNKIVPLQPDFALLMHNINDLSLLLYEQTYWNQNEYRSPIIDEDKSIKAFLKLLLPNTYEFIFRIKANLGGHVDEFAEQRGQHKNINIEHIQKMFQSNLKIFIEISRAKDIRPVLMTQANRFTEEPEETIRNHTEILKNIGIEYDEYKILYDDMNESIRKVARENNVLLIDLAKEVPQTSQYMVDSVHFSDFGSEHAAAIIAAALKQQK